MQKQVWIIKVDYQDASHRNTWFLTGITSHLTHKPRSRHWSFASSTLPHEREVLINSKIPHSEGNGCSESSFNCHSSCGTGSTHVLHPFGPALSRLLRFMAVSPASPATQHACEAS